MDGVAVIHLRATVPEAIDTDSLHLGELTDLPDSRISALDVWVDGDTTAHGSQRADRTAILGS